MLQIPSMNKIHNWQNLSKSGTVLQNASETHNVKELFSRVRWSDLQIYNYKVTLLTFDFWPMADILPFHLHPTWIPNLLVIKDYFSELQVVFQKYMCYPNAKITNK